MSNKKLFYLVAINLILILSSFSLIGSILSLLFSLLFLIVDIILIVYFISLKDNISAKLLFLVGMIYVLITILYSPLANYISDIWDIGKADYGYVVTYQNQVIGTFLSWLRVLIPLDAFLITLNQKNKEISENKNTN